MRQRRNKTRLRLHVVFLTKTLRFNNNKPFTSGNDGILQVLCRYIFTNKRLATVYNVVRIELKFLMLFDDFSVAISSNKLSPISEVNPGLKPKNNHNISPK
ncbi:hypothetical protein ACHWQZ_G002846 [Mnemiopsis leidyi]